MMGYVIRNSIFFGFIFYIDFFFFLGGGAKFYLDFHQWKFG